MLTNLETISIDDVQLAATDLSWPDGILGTIGPIERAT